MKWVKTTITAVAVIGVAVSQLQAAPAIEKPAVMPEAMLSISVPDVHGFLDEVGAVAAQSSPMMSGMMLKNMIGMQLGDPQLMGIAPGKGFSIVALDITNIFAVVEVSEAQSAAYLNTAKTKGLEAKYVNGVLVLSKDPAALAKGAGLSGSVQSKILSKRGPVIRIVSQPAAIIERNREVVEGFLDKIQDSMAADMAKSPGADAEMVANTTKILEGELRFFVSLAEQCESDEVVVALEDGSIRISETFAPKVGTALGALVNSPKTTKPNPRLQAGLFNDGLLMLDFVIGNPDALTAFVKAETEKIIKAMELKDADVSGITDMMVKWMDVYAGSGCEAVDFDSEDGFNASYALQVADEKKALDLFKTMQSDMAPFLKLYEQLGMPIEFSFKENVREHKGIPIHQFSTTFGLEEMLPEQRKQMEAMKINDMKFDLAVTDDVLLYAIGENGIEKAIDKIKDEAFTPSPIKARTVYPADGFYYLDFDVARYMELIGGFMPEGQPNPFSPEVVALLQGVDPITSAGFRNNGLVKWSVNIPGDLLGKLSQIGMMIQMQQMQQ